MAGDWDIVSEELAPEHVPAAAANDPWAVVKEEVAPGAQRDPSFFGGLGQDWSRGVAQVWQNLAATRGSSLQTLQQNQGLVEAYPGGPKIPILPDIEDPTKAAPETFPAIQAGLARAASDIVTHQGTIAANPPPQVVEDISRANADRDFMTAWDVFKTHPIDAIASTTVNSFPQMLAALGIGAVTRNPAAGAVAMGLSSGAGEWGGAIMDALQEEAKRLNIPLTAETAAMIMQDPKVMEAARQRGGIRAGIIGTIDAATGGAASLNLIPKRLVTGPVTREVANLVPQTALQMAGGGGGEALGELAATGKVNWGDVLLEMVGELGSAPVEVAGMGRHAISERLNAASARRNAGQAPVAGDLDAVQSGLALFDAAIANATEQGNTTAAAKIKAARDQLAANFTGVGESPTAAAERVLNRVTADETAAVGQRMNAGIDPSTLTPEQQREAGIVPGMPEAEAIRKAMVYEAEQRARRAEISGTMPPTAPPLPDVIALPDQSLAAPGDQTPVNRGTPVGGSPGLAEGALLRGGGTGTALVPTQPQAQPMTEAEVAAAQQQTRQQDREQAARGQQPQADVSDIDTQLGRIDKLLSGTNLDPASRTQLEQQRARLAQTRADRLGIGRPMTAPEEGPARSAGQQEMVQQAEVLREQDHARASEAFALAERQRMRTYTDEQLNGIADDPTDPRAPHAALELRRRQRGESVRAGMDTQPAGQTGGPVRTQVLTHVQDGVEYPVKVMGRDAQGRVLVQRYDPRTGEVEPGSVPYIVKGEDLNTRIYTQEPRRAQDVTQRAEVGRVSAGRAAGQRIDVVQGLLPQTYRVTPEDPNQQFPGPQAERDTGRSPIPEQQPREPNSRQWSREEEFMRDYARREEQRRQRDEEAQRRRREQGQSEEQPKPKGKKGERSTNEARAVDGAFPVDAEGHVVSTGGGPIIFGTQLQAAKWILNVGHKESTRQIFQIANHPTTNNTFSVQQTGLSEEPGASPGDQAEPTPETPGGPAPEPRPPGPPPQLGGPTDTSPSPPSTGPSTGGAGGPAGPAAPTGTGVGPGGSPASGGRGSPGGPTTTEGGVTYRAFMQGETTALKRLDIFDAEASPEAKAQVQEAEQTAQELETAIQELGYEGRNDKRINMASLGRETTNRAKALRQQISFLMGQIGRKVNAEVGQIRNYKTAKPDAVRAETAELTKQVEAARALLAEATPAPQATPQVDPQVEARRSDVASALPAGTWFYTLDTSEGRPRAYGPQQVHQVTAHRDGSVSVTALDANDVITRGRAVPEPGKPAKAGDAAIGVPVRDATVDANGNVVDQAPGNDGRRVMPISEADARRLAGMLPQEAEAEMVRMSEGGTAPAPETTPQAEPQAETTATPTPREQATQGKAAQAASVEAIQSAARESPVGQWMREFEARVAADNPVLAAAIKRASAALRPYLMRAAYAGVAAVEGATGGVDARNEAVAAIVKDAVAAMRNEGKGPAEAHAISAQFKEDLNSLYRRGEYIAEQMQGEDKPIPAQRQIEATTRTARGQETNYSFGSAASAEATAERLAKQRGVTFYSFPGMLFDPQLWSGLGKSIAHVGRLLLGERADWEQFGGTMTALGTSLSNLASGIAKGPGHAASATMQAMERTVGAAVRSSGGAIRAIARSRNSAVLRQLANDLDAPSRGMAGAEGTGRAWNEAFRIKRNEVGRQVSQLTRRLAELVSSAPRTQDESNAQRALRVEAQLVAQIRNPSARRGELGRLAGEVAALLKGLRDYAVAAGVEMGNAGPGYLPRMFNADTVANGQAEFIRIAEAAYRRQGVPAADATKYAEELMSDVQKGGFGIPGHSGAFAGAPASVKSRTFDNQAERDFQKAGFYVNDLEHMLLTYRDQIVRRAEIARRWGDGWKNWHEKVITPLRKEPGNDDAWLANTAADYAEVITGTKPTAGGRGMQNAVGWLRAMTGFAVLGNVTLTSLFEATAVGARTGRADEAVRAVVGSLTEAGREILRMEPSQRRQVAEELGLLAGDVLASANAGRFGSGDGTRVAIARKEARFYRAVGLEQITNGQYVSVAQSGIRMLDRAARGVLGDATFMSPERGKQMLGELGIAADQAEAFSRYWQSIRRDNQGKNTRQPTPEAFATPMGQAAQTALYRFVTQIIQTPDAGSRPRWASTTTGSLIFNLNSFAWSFARNVTLANAKLAGQAFTGEGTGAGLKGLADRAAYLAPTIIGTGLLMAASLATIGLKDATEGTDPEDIERRSRGWWWEQVARRSGLLMAADPILQASAAALYGREPITSLSGPTAGIWAELASGLNQLIVKNSEKSNAAERRAARAVWDVAVAPGLIYMILAARVPGLIGAIPTVAVGSKRTRNWAVDTAAGEEADASKNRRQRRAQQGIIEQIMGGED